jgi:heme/copper-type cytochrome/quinol oxidase subunit 2
MKTLLFLVILMWLVTPSAASQTYHIDMTQFEFSPHRIHVNKGDHVVITLTSSDVTHGFYLDGYDIEQRVDPGIPQQIEFVADRSGKFRFRCSVSCGSLHPFMIGELVVEDNTPYHGAVGMAVFALTGMMIFLWRTHNDTTFA